MSAAAPPPAVGPADPADLIARLGGALDVAERAIAYLLPEGYADAQQPTAGVSAEKVVSETALLLLKAGTLPGEAGLAARARAIGLRLAPHARSAAMARGLCLEPGLALDYGMAHACLSRLGLEDAAFDALLRAAQASQALLGRERPPHRALEQCWIAAIAGAPPPAPGAAAWAGLSALCRPMDLLGGNREDVYALTHALMYAADLPGLAELLAANAGRIAAEVECLLARCLDDEDYDLAGELLLAWPALRAPWTVAPQFALRVLTWVEDQAGFLPCPALRIEHANRLQGAERTRYLLATSYHTAYVMGLLAAACLGRPPALAASAGQADMASAVEMLPAAGHAPHWEQLLGGNSPRSDDPGLAAFVMQIGLHRAYRARDFQRLCDLLRLARDAGLERHPAWVQAAELLARADELARAVQEAAPASRGPG